MPLYNYLWVMKEQAPTYLDFIIDKLTRSVENAVTGDSFQTEVLPLTKADLRSMIRKSGWNFDWKQELSANDREVYKLTIQGNPTIVQAAMSLRMESDHLYMPLIESAPFNRGKDKMYLGVPGNLVAFACRLSFQKGYQGFVSFHSKTKLVGHYERTLGAFHFGGQLMIVNTDAANLLVERYFKS